MATLFILFSVHATIVSAYVFKSIGELLTPALLSPTLRQHCETYII